MREDVGKTKGENFYCLKTKTKKKKKYIGILETQPTLIGQNSESSFLEL